MIERPTVLILGAGASMPFDFPSGDTLLHKVHLATDLNQNYADKLVDPKIPDGPRYREYRGDVGFLVDMGLNTDMINKFRTALWNSGKMSVDAFLEHRPEFMDVGKASIARILSRYENPFKLIERTRTTSNWYTYLFNKLNAKEDDFVKNRLSIITYNYDRSLEFFLYTCLKYSYDLTDTDAVNLLKTIPFVHLHGQLSNKAFVDAGGQTYGNFIEDDIIKQAASGIKIIHEDIDDDPQFIEAHKLLSQAHFICFLGFGYDKTNLERLKLHDVAPEAKYFGTAYDKTPAEVNELVDFLPKQIGLRIFAQLGPKGHGNLAYLHEINILK